MNLSPKILRRLEECADRYLELEGLLGDADTVRDQELFIKLSREYSGLQPIIESYRKYESLQAEIAELNDLRNGPDDEIKNLAREMLADTQPKLDEACGQLETMLVPQDPDDAANVYLEIRAGTGGDEAGLFAADLARMYEKYAAVKGWTIQLITFKPSTQGGCKEAIFRITGKNVFSRLKFESGAHRVQRVPITESQGRVHTSACTVAILPEIETVEEISLKSSELRIDTYRASGAGGQHVNKTDSAVRITHLPSGVVVECQDERSQHLNKERALSLLTSKLMNAEKQAKEQQRSDDRRLQIGSGDRSERIRTYNFPQGRLTDHRVNLTLYKLDEVMEGSLDQVIEPLIKEHQADLLRELHDETTENSYVSL